MDDIFQVLRTIEEITWLDELAEYEEEMFGPQSDLQLARDIIYVGRPETVSHIHRSIDVLEAMVVMAFNIRKKQLEGML